ncbi:hypothetical protein [Limnoglobus roseus]|uniref:Uncharacterized protein n=1 Tax=Limnoglobus roseus TaxID=2598579 RepID=A0A5C1A6H9_9BACT|nr:hypothetical protein [Limnoglobus roseus]QEL14849.1 hypothetical protein PX52LOC_01747 [Limnoglobus roseus]
MATKMWTLTKRTLVAGLTPAAASPISGRPGPPRDSGRAPETLSGHQSYRGRFLPGEFPPALVEPVTRALDCRKGKTVTDLLLRDRAGYLGTAWTRRNLSLLADYLPVAFEAAMAALVRMVNSGDVQTVPDLQVRIEQVLAVTARKYGSRSYKRLNPKVGHGRPKQSGEDAKDRPKMFVSGGPVPAEKVDGGPRPDEAATAAELADILDQARAALDPREVQIFDAVQAHRVRHGVKAAYPAAVRTLVTDGHGKPIPEGGAAFAAAVRSVRRTFLTVRQVLAARATAAGYAVPPARERRTKRKPAGGQSPEGTPPA